MPHAVTSRVLFIDAYDSFSNNIISLLETRLPAVEVAMVRIDEDIADFPAFLRAFDGVVAGAGPGHPNNRKDVGLIAELWQLSDQDLLPVLGICLGFQSLVTAFGGKVVPLPAPRHGIVRTVSHDGLSIFRGVDSIAPVQYHSLYARLPEDRSRSSPRWLPNCSDASKGCNDMEPLAWDLERENSSSVHIQEHAANPESILMAARHRQKPFYGVQFHPESICSDEGCRQIVTNWWSEAQEWCRQYKTRPPNWRSEDALPKPLGRADSSVSIGPTKRPFHNHVPGDSESILGIPRSTSPHASSDEKRRVISRILPLSGLTIPDICDLLQIEIGDAVVLDSEPHQRADVGTHSIIGAVNLQTLKFDYSVGSAVLTARRGKHSELVDLNRHGNSIFNFLKAFLHDQKATTGNPDIPFWGGLIGYISYEACLETLGMTTSYPMENPDISFAFVERSVVIDHTQQLIHIQTIMADDQSWVEWMASKIAGWKPAPRNGPSACLDAAISDPLVSSYKSNIRKCQEYIRSGDSYELCLTNQAYVTTRHLPSVWPLYLRLRSLNAAPFSAYVRLGGLTLLSSSPERFMRWTRPISTSDGCGQEISTIQFRPIKGTVKRYPNGPDEPAINLEQAKALLSTPKERAENLMIVDLIRHDLHGVVGSGNVCVPKLMVVEEYATLFQLVTVVEGNLTTQQSKSSEPPSLTTSPESSPCSSRPDTPASCAGSLRCRQSQSSHTVCQSTGQRNGIDVLAASLPPGSMTGAPKRRSCALLREIEEQQPRGIYSGIVGYMDVGGAGDFSVVIRSAFRWDKDTVQDEENSDEKRDTWTVGAGGAVTSLSTEEGEWQEMVAKLGSTLRMFE
ncbi:MAG: hypothetical protein LQ346_007883 [Caloplaca aetnensis]|nr:MAG: hypothetical protein LQ346_007883 [Caloplaca aetnensis]